MWWNNLWHWEPLLEITAILQATTCHTQTPGLLLGSGPKTGAIKFLTLKGASSENWESFRIC